MDVLTLIGAIGLSYIGYMAGYYLADRFRELIAKVFKDRN